MDIVLNGKAGTRRKIPPGGWESWRAERIDIDTGKVRRMETGRLNREARIAARPLECGIDLPPDAISECYAATDFPGVLGEETEGIGLAPEHHLAGVAGQRVVGAEGVLVDVVLHQVK